MGLLEPWHIVVLLIFFGVPFGILCGFIGRKRYIGGTWGFVLGFFLGPIGMAVVFCSNINEPDISFPVKVESIPDQIRKYKELLDAGAISEAEYDQQKTKLLNQH
jgi:hypothetical protein